MCRRFLSLTCSCVMYACRGCYGKPIISTSSTGKSLLTLLVPTGSPLVDRVVVAEDQTKGQLIRNFTLTGMLTNGSSVLITNGTSVGNKYIAIMPQALPLQAVQLNVTRITPLSPSGAPFIRNFALHGCSDLAEALDEDWAQTWGKE